MTKYDEDIVVWAREQASFLRSGQFSKLDIEHLADEIESVAFTEHQVFAARLTVLLASMIKRVQNPDQHSKSADTAIKRQRAAVLRCLRKTPSLKNALSDASFVEDIWGDAISDVLRDTNEEPSALVKKWNLHDILQESESVLD